MYNGQRPENAISSLACVDSSHLRHRLLDYRRMLRVSWTEHQTDQSILTELNTQTASRNYCAPQSLWPQNQRWRMRAGQV